MYFLKKRNVFNFKFTIERLYSLSFNQGQFGGVKGGTINYTKTRYFDLFYQQNEFIWEEQRLVIQDMQAMVNHRQV